MFRVTFWYFRVVQSNKIFFLQKIFYDILHYVKLHFFGGRVFKIWVGWVTRNTEFILLGLTSLQRDSLTESCWHFILVHLHWQALGNKTAIFILDYPQINCEYFPYTLQVSWEKLTPWIDSSIFPCNILHNFLNVLFNGFIDEFNTLLRWFYEGQAGLILPRSFFHALWADTFFKNPLSNRFSTYSNWSSFYIMQ